MRESIRSLIRSFGYAFEGIAEAFKTQRNMRIHGLFAIFALVANALLGISSLEWLAIIICIVIVFSLECVNTAIESAVDLVSRKHSPLAKRAKDCAAGAVLVAAIGSVVVGLWIYIPYVVRLFA